jgi:hypothetical protein
MTTYYRSHVFTTTRCDNCGVTFTKVLLDEADCMPDVRVGGPGS